MKRRLKALLMAIVMILSTVSMSFGDITLAKADTTESGIIVRFHYKRTDGNYTGWNMWLWTPTTTGTAYEFTGTDADGGKTVEFKVNSATLAANYIVRLNEWEEKDVEEDRSIDLSDVTGGEVEVYLNQGVAEPTKVDKDNAVKGCKAKSVNATDTKTIVVEFSKTPESDITVVDENDTELAIESISNKDNVYTITLSEEVDPLGAYYVVLDGNKFAITMPEYFSTDAFESKYTYTGDDLGATWSSDSTTFKLWAPTAKGVSVKLYKSGTEGVNDEISTTAMTKGEKGTWSVTIDEDLNGVYYTYLVDFGSYQKESIDPYAKTCGVNGKRGMVIDLDSTDPEGWSKDTNPNKGLNYTDAVLYELHVRDFSYDTSSGIKNKGKFLAFTETGTKNSSGQSTGIDYLKDLGITHLHILPAYDYATVDESKLDKDQFNWGYDPQNYNIPEGSYSTDPYNGAVRVNEYKQMVQSLHNNGISVVMDVVYNHTFSDQDFSFDLIVPGYFHRPGANGSGCGNDNATERSMVRKYIVDSVIYWAKEYHIDGFRFDISGLIDNQTMQEIEKEIHAYDPNIILYNEGWTMRTVPTKDGLKFANQLSASSLPGYAFFSDNIRDAIKGSVLSEVERGFVTGNIYSSLGIARASAAKNPWATDPVQIVNYASCHDNRTLFDRIQFQCPEDTFETKVKRNNLSAAIIYTAQGIPFMQAGEELLRTKVLPNGEYDHNSYSSSSEENCIKWDDLSKDAYKETYDYYKGLIEFRKQHTALRMTTKDDVNKYLTMILDGDNDQGLVEYQLSGDVKNEISDGIVVIFNGNTEDQTVNLPEGDWNVCVNAKKAGTDVLATASGSVKVDALSAMVLVKGATKSDNPNGVFGNDGSNASEKATSANTSVATGDKTSTVMLFVVLSLAVVAVCAGVVVGKRKQFNK